MKNANVHTGSCWLVSLLILIFLNGFFALSAQAANQQGMSANKAQVVKHWTPERVAHATPRDLVIDPRGLGYLRKSDGSLVPHGHQVVAEKGTLAQVPMGKPPGAGGGGGGSDTTAPTISNMDPAEGSIIGEAHTFSAVVADTSGVKSVSFVIRFPNGVNTQTFSAVRGSGDTWSASLSSFSDGAWGWSVEAKDGAAKGGNSGSSTLVNFVVETAGSGGGGSGGGTGADTIINDAWTAGGAVQTAVGRIYFEMPSNKKHNRPWNGYVCSGSIVTDATTGRSVILTAAHCVYDDAYKAFARNVLFIPNQAATTGSGTDLNCNNDPLGCWAPDFGVVDGNWTTNTFPDNVAWDYAYYVVGDEPGNELDAIAGSLMVNFFTLPMIDDGDPGAHSVDFSHALGYSYSDDPNFMYCAEDMTTEGSANWWLPSCELSGGASGGPWVQRMDVATGSGPVISVNSWGYTTAPGMAGPKLVGTSASCLFDEAKGLSFDSISSIDGKAGVAVDYCP